MSLFKRAKTLFPEQVWHKVNPDGKVVDSKSTRRPSGPILSNVDWHKGYLWVKAQ